MLLLLQGDYDGGDYLDDVSGLNNIDYSFYTYDESGVDGGFFTGKVDSLTKINKQIKTYIGDINPYGQTSTSSLITRIILYLYALVNNLT